MFQQKRGFTEDALQHRARPYLPAAAMEQPVLQLSSHEPPAHEPQPSEPARTLQLRLQTWKGAPRVAVLHPYNSDTFRVSETDSEQIEKVSLFYVGAGARVCAVLSRRPVPTRAEAANTDARERCFVWLSGTTRRKFGCCSVPLVASGLAVAGILAQPAHVRHSGVALGVVPLARQCALRRVLEAEHDAVFVPTALAVRLPVRPVVGLAFAPVLKVVRRAVGPLESRACNGSVTQPRAVSATLAV